MAKTINIDEIRKFIQWLEPGASETRINALISSYLATIK
jgi:hypothetical protein